MFSLPLQLASSAATPTVRTHEVHRSRRNRRARTTVIRLVPSKDPRGFAAPYPSLEGGCRAAFRQYVFTGPFRTLKPSSLPVSGLLVEVELDARRAAAAQVDGGGKPLPRDRAGWISRFPRAHGHVVDAAGRAAGDTRELHRAAASRE